jgi:hypothetical protein
VNVCTAARCTSGACCARVVPPSFSGCVLHALRAHDSCLILIALRVVAAFWLLVLGSCPALLVPWILPPYHLLRRARASALHTRMHNILPHLHRRAKAPALCARLLNSTLPTNTTGSQRPLCSRLSLRGRQTLTVRRHLRERRKPRSRTSHSHRSVLSVRVRALVRPCTHMPQGKAGVTTVLLHGISLP